MAVATLAQTIAFCAQNRLLMQITYNGSVRLVEVYSFRPAANPGDLLLYAYDIGKGRTNSYKVGSIEHVVATSTQFSPRYPIEIS